MPRIEEIPFDYSTLSLSEEDEFRTRTPGLHLTDITKSILQDSGLGKYATSKPDEQKMFFEQGFLWERLIGKILSHQMDRDIKLSDGRLCRVGEYTDSGIIATPDAIDTVGWWLEEWKATSIRSTNLTKDTLSYKKPEWLWATGFHCKHFGMDSVVFRIWHYSEFPPKVKQYRVVWTEEELLTNYDRIMNHARAKGML